MRREGRESHQASLLRDCQNPLSSSIPTRGHGRYKQRHRDSNYKAERDPSLFYTRCSSWASMLDSRPCFPRPLSGLLRDTIPLGMTLS